MTTVVNPIDHEDLYNHIILGGVKSPGVVTLSGHDRKVGWDVKTVQGTKGATTTLKDMPPIEFSATFYLVRDDALGVDDFEDWPAFLGLIQSTISGPTPKALDIYHPDLVANWITSVVMSVGGGVVHDGKGGQHVTIKFQEYKPAKPAGGNPKPPTSGATNKADPDAAALAQLDQLTKQFEATPWG